MLGAQLLNFGAPRLKVSRLDVFLCGSPYEQVSRPGIVAFDAFFQRRDLGTEDQTFLVAAVGAGVGGVGQRILRFAGLQDTLARFELFKQALLRSEERRVGKGCRRRRVPEQSKA